MNYTCVNKNIRQVKLRVKILGSVFLPLMPDTPIANIVFLIFQKVMPCMVSKEKPSVISQSVLPICNRIYLFQYCCQFNNFQSFDTLRHSNNLILNRNKSSLKFCRKLSISFDPSFKIVIILHLHHDLLQKLSSYTNMRPSIVIELYNSPPVFFSPC